MLPKITDWIKNPQKAATDVSTFQYAAEAITQPLIAYEREINAIWSSRMGLLYSRPMAYVSVLFALVLSYSPRLSDTEKNGSLLFAAGHVAHVFVARRKIRASSAATLTLRDLHPSMESQFTVIEDVFRTTPVVHERDIDGARRRADTLHHYAKRLGLEHKL